ncbi:hypothetical protein Q2T41_07110 [Maribacter confluentis]|uniref:Uncharacterized protein n=1 Tax=Maribacter confluentis TaxID=1656093 RepID=A0ABT8RNE3_9FLAO|nr:hypothetical protein [Maribacter confluentis]MDO1512418.1 hypothetical protein [Maribacter confluentis]
MSILTNYQEILVVDKGIEELKKSILHEKHIFVKWISQTDCILSLPFSIGTNYALDLNNDAKSAIIVYATFSNLSKTRTQIKLYTTFKYGLLLILLIPIIMLALELTVDLGIPLAFYFVFPIVYVMLLIFIRAEEKKLINRFKGLIINV